MFSKNQQTSTTTPSSKQAHEHGRNRHWITLAFSWFFLLAILELGFTVDTFQYLQKKQQWQSNTERARIGFLLFSSVRSALLALVYIGSNILNRWFGSLHHTIYLVLNTIFWIVSGVLIKQTLGVVECGGVGHLKGGLNECHELKIIEILAWVIAASSILITIPVVMGASKRQKHKAEKGETQPQKRGWFGLRSKKVVGGPAPTNEKHMGPSAV
ncbi:hypothetical protein C8J56DRAFT_823549, partial [Mycena floridula]